MNMSSDKQSGFSLVELMIALTIGLLLTAAVLQTFLSMKRSYEFQEEFARLQENGRFAMEFLSKDIRNAGFWGCNGSGLGSIQNHLASQSMASFSFGDDIDGSNGTENGSNSALDESDSILLRTAVDSGINVLDVPATTSAVLKVTENSGLQIGDIVLISDCTEGEIFQISTDPSTGAAGFDNVGHNTGNISQGGTTYVPGNATQEFQKIYGTDAQVYSASSEEYRIQTRTGADLSSLYKGDHELVEGVENLQVLYGEDTDNDGVPNYYAPADHSSLDMDDVVSVRISLLLTSLRDNLTDTPQSIEYNNGTLLPTDRRIRKVFSSQIALRNRLD